jgi:hypothetical protein
MRTVYDRSALAPGVRVQLSFIKHAPYTQRADLTVSDRLATIVSREPCAWLALDDTGERHRLEDDQLEVAEADATRGRWRIESAVPIYHLGERLRLSWLYRSRARPDPARDDCEATVVAGGVETVDVRLDDGTVIVLYRFGAQADAPDRREPRWFVVARLP